MRQKKSIKVGKRPKMKIHAGDTVEVISGSAKGKQGTVLRTMPYQNRVVVQNVNVRVKHLKKSKESPKGGRIDREAPIHISNVKLVASAGA